MIVRDEDFAAAFARMARTPDGRIIRVYLETKLRSLAPASGEAATFFRHEGARIHAADLIRLMDRDLDGTGERSGGRDGYGQDGDRVVVERGRYSGRPRGGAGRRGQ